MRTSVATLATVAVLLSAVFVVVTLDVRERVRAEVTDKLEARLRVLSALEDRRGDELASQVAMLAENSTLKAALDIYQSEMATAKPANHYELSPPSTRELEKIAARVKAGHPCRDGRFRTDGRGGGPPQSCVARQHAFEPTTGGSALRLARRRRVFGWRAPTSDCRTPSSAGSNSPPRSTSSTRASSSRFGGSHADRHIRNGGGDHPAASRRRITHSDVLRSLSSSRVARLGDGEYAVRELLQERDAGVYVLDSIDAASRGRR